MKKNRKQSCSKLLGVSLFLLIAWHQNANALENQLRTLVSQSSAGATDKDGSLLYKKAKELEQQGNYSAAIKTWEELLALAQKPPQSSQKVMLIIIGNLALLNTQQGEYKKAESLYNRLLPMLEGGFDSSSSDKMHVLNNLAYLHEKQGRLDKVEKIYRQSLAIAESLGFEKDIALVLNNMGVLFLRQAQYDKSEAFLVRGLTLREKVLGPDDSAVAESIANLAYLYVETGKYSKAENLFLRSLSISRKTIGQEHPNTATIANNLGLLYQVQGQLSKAEPLFKSSLAAREKYLGIEHSSTAESLNNLAMLYQSQGQFGNAETLLQRSLKIIQKSLGDDHSSAGLILGNLALVKKDQNQYLEAEILSRRSIEIKQKTLGEDHPSVAVDLSNLASLEVVQGRFAAAEEHYARALSIIEKSKGIGGSDYADILNGMGLLFNFQKKYAKAENAFRQSLRIFEKNYGVDDIRDKAMLGNLGFALLYQKHFDEAIKPIAREAAAITSWLYRELPFMSVDARSVLQSEAQIGYHLPFALLRQYEPAAFTALTASINQKGLLQEIQKRQGDLMKLPDSPRELVRQIQSYEQRLSGIDLSSERKVLMRRERDRLEEDLYRQLPELTFSPITAKQVASVIPGNGLLVEYKKYLPADLGLWGAAHYVALLLGPDGSIGSVQLGPAKPIDEAIHEALRATADNTSDAPQLWAGVSRLVLTPLKAKLKNRKQVFISPDGELNRVPFASLSYPLQPSDTFGSAVQLRLLTTGRDLLRLENPPAKGQSPLVMANPNYDRAQLAAPYSITTNKSQVQQRSSTVGSSRWSQLPATRKEGEQVATLLGVNSIMGDQATTSRLQQSKGPRVLHVASHGFFAPDQETKSNDSLRSLQETGRQVQGFKGESPMLRSGLVLAGANQPNANPNDDGYLTAAEATQLQLEGTELVVLSACSTGQGDIRSGEGVYGLQRALTVAGARSTLLSLWKVDDKATAEFMVRFYKRLKAGEPRSDALAATQKDFRDGKTGISGWRDPFYWAAWQLVGDWRPIKGL